MKLDCQRLNQASDESPTRVKDIDDAAPDCVCEKCSMSADSPGVVEDHETLVRFAFNPMHLRADGSAKSSLFSQVFTNGCSVQRDDLARDDELKSFVANYLAHNPKQNWRGLFRARCSDVRRIENSTYPGRRAACVYDTATPENPAHAEICATRFALSEADPAEVRAELFRVFDADHMILPRDYRGGRLV